MAGFQGDEATLKWRSEVSESRTSGIGSKNWARAEKAADEIIWSVQPNSLSEDMRREITDYVKRLIRNTLGAEVFSYGSVPFKTYLPSGDIDLTVFGGPTVEDSLAADVKAILEKEAKSLTAEFVVKDIQFIGAQVKIVRCMVQNIVIDVSFNQIGGLCSLCFMEQVDRFIGKYHLFKRSILLVKSWCYYESRTHGANHGLISTHALEILVLYIIHFFHSKLNGPLAVLHKFLDYFGKFDWETYGISLTGPFRLSGLPAISGEMPEECDGNLLLSHDFLISCVDMFSVPYNNSRGFQRKHLNIVDPLKVVNNLGRSVSKGNLYRILGAFKYGARRLTSVLEQPNDVIASDLRKFFSNTTAKHGSGLGPHPEHYNFVKREFSSNLCNSFPELVEFHSSSLLDLTGDLESYFHCLQYGRWSIDGGLPLHSAPIPHDGLFFPAPHFMQNEFLYQHHSNPVLYTFQPTLIPHVPMWCAEIPRSQGTGRYFGNMNQPPEGYSSHYMRRRNDI